MKIKLLLWTIITLFSLISPIFAVTTITEIHPHDAEFVEIFSNTQEDFSQGIIYDSNNNSSNNTLTKIRNSSSSFSLIVGSNFVEENDISKLDCSIYQTSGTQVSKGGLLSGGEELRILNKNNLYEWIPKKEYDLLNNESIDAHLRKKIKTSPCEFTPLSDGEILPKKNPNSLKCDCPSFSINQSPFIENSSLSYGFETDATNFTITYWIERYNGDIAKEPFNTTSLTKKSFTPQRMDIYNIKAELHTPSCVVEDEKKVLYYKQNSKEEPIQNSSIIIENKQELSSDSLNQIHYQIQRGDTRKRVVSFFIGEEKISSVYPNKHSSISGRIYLGEKMKSKNLTIEGLGVSKSFKLTSSTHNKDLDKTQSNSQEQTQQKTSDNSKQTSNDYDLNTNNKNKKMKIFTKNITHNTTHLRFYANATHTGDFECYLANGMVELSEEIKQDISKQYRQYILNINKSKITNRNLTHNELFCKFKKTNLKTYESKRIPVKTNFSQENNTSYQYQEINEEFLQQSNNSSQNQTIKSEQISLKNKVIFGFIGVLLLIIGLFLIFR